MSLANWTTRILVEEAQGDDDPKTVVAPPTEPHSLVGSRVGAYLVTKRLGAGGVGEVFKGEDVMLKREVAIKVLRHEFACDALFVERFRREAQLHAQLSHPNIVSVHAFLHEGDAQFMVMEYVQGISLDEFVRSGGPVPAERALNICRRALDGIEHAHRNGIVHRDLKPANIMLADSGQVKVMDFGIARALDCHEHLTRHGQVAGTAKSMSPEQIRGAQADARSDVYSLGIVLYTLLAGRAPFDGNSDHALMKAQLEQTPPPLHTLVDGVPPSVQAAVTRALEKDPAARFQTAAAFSRALDACLAEFGAEAPGLDRSGTQTSSRTAVNLELQHMQQLPEREARQRPRRLARGLRAAAMALALPALAAGTWLAWPTLSRFDGLEALFAALPPLPERTHAPPPPAKPAAPRTTLAIAQLPEGSAAPDATHRFRPGERIRLRVTPSLDAYVYCYLQDEARDIRRFYPNRFSESALVRAAAPLEIPGSMRFEIVANTLKATETVACFASPRDLTKELPAAVLGTDFAKLDASSLDEVREAFDRVGSKTLAQASLRIESE